MDDVEKPVDVDVVTAVVEVAVDDTLLEDELLVAKPPLEEDEALTTNPGFGGTYTTGQG